MHALSQRLKDRFFKPEEHPYTHLEQEITARLTGRETVLDAGCGHGAEVLRRFSGKAHRLIGVDLVDFDDFDRETDDLELYNVDLADIPVEARTVDLVFSRSVFEHLPEPLTVYRELNRVLKPGGEVIVLTPNLGDYASWISKLTPNRWHPWIVAHTEGRAEADTFPAFYRTNTERRIRYLADQGGFELTALRYLGQYPSYFMFNPILFLLATGYEKLISRFEILRFLRGWLLFSLKKVAEAEYRDSGRLGHHGHDG